MKIAAAQIHCEIGEIPQNLQRHYQVIEQAIELGADLIIFPELSITGYCREEARELAFVENDPRLAHLIKLSKQGNLIVAAGAPVLIAGELFIATFIVNPNGQIDIYTKQNLHAGEEVVYSSSAAFNPLIKIQNELVAFSICADINHRDHVIQAKNIGATIYAPGIFFSDQGTASGMKTLGEYAKEHELNVLISNYCGNHWGIDAGGNSAFWDNKGTLHAALKPTESGLVIASKEGDSWTAECSRVLLS